MRQRPLGGFLFTFYVLEEHNLSLALHTTLCEQNGGWTSHTKIDYMTPLVVVASKKSESQSQSQSQSQSRSQSQSQALDCAVLWPAQHRSPAPRAAASPRLATRQHETRLDRTHWL